MAWGVLTCKLPGQPDLQGQLTALSGPQDQFGPLTSPRLAPLDPGAPSPSALDAPVSFAISQAPLTLCTCLSRTPLLFCAHVTSYRESSLNADQLKFPINAADTLCTP